MSAPKLKKSKINLLTVSFIVYSYSAVVCFGVEDIVGWGGPGLTFLVLLIIPLIWGVPMALVSAELTSMYPETGGIYIWVRNALGEFPGFLAGWWYMLCNLVATAVFLVLVVSYIENLAGGFSTPVRVLVSSGIVIAIAWINIRGVGAMGVSSGLFLFIALMPFLVATIWGLFQMQYNPFASFSPPIPADGDLSSFTSYGLILGMWMFCGYEAIGSVAEEVEGAYYLIPRSLFIVIPVAIIIYLAPTMVGAAVVGDWSNWGAEAGPGIITYVEMGRIIGGNALMIAFLISALFANLAAYNAYVASNGRFPFVMARDNLFPKSFAKISPKYGTPAIAIAVTSAVNIVLSTQSFGALLVMSMTLYFIPALLYMLSVLVMRFTKPNQPRPYQVPGGKPVLIIFFILVSSLIGLAFWHMTRYELISGAIGLATGPVAYLFVKWRYGGLSKQELEELANPTDPALATAAGEQ